MKHLWTLWWIRASVLDQGVFPFATELVNHPAGLDLYPIEPLNGIFAVLLGFLPLVFTANLLALGNLAATGVCGAMLGRRLCPDPEAREAAGLAAGTLLQTSAFVSFTIHVGVGELQHVWWIPLGLCAWLDVSEHRRWKDGLRLALCLVGATLSGFYLGFFLALSVAVLSLLRLLSDRKRLALLGRYALAATLVLAILVPVARFFSASYGEGEPPRIGLIQYVLESGHGQPVTDPVSARLDPAELVRPAREARASASRELLAYGGGRYLGWPLLVLIGLGIHARGRRSIPWLVVGSIGAVLATGSYLVIGGLEYSTPTITRLGMPFLSLNRALGYVAEPINFPNRFLVITVVAASALAALAAGGQIRGRQLAGPVLALSLLNAVDVRLHDLNGSGLSRFALTDYTALASVEDGQAVVDLNLAWRADPETRGASQAAQMIHRQAIQGVPIERVEQFARDGQVLVQTLPMVAKLEPAFMYQREVVLDVEEHREDLALLRANGFDRVLLLGIGVDNSVAPALVSALEPLLGTPLLSDRRAVLFQIPAVDASPEEIATWQHAHELRIKAWWGRQESKVGQPLR